MTRTAIGPFSLNTDTELDRRIVEFFGMARPRGKSDLFREVMEKHLDNGQAQDNASLSAILALSDKLSELFESGVRIDKQTSEIIMADDVDPDDADSDIVDPLIAQAQKALDNLAM